MNFFGCKSNDSVSAVSPVPVPRLPRVGVYFDSQRMDGVVRLVNDVSEVKRMPVGEWWNSKEHERYTIHTLDWCSAELIDSATQSNLIKLIEHHAKHLDWILINVYSGPSTFKWNYSLVDAVSKCRDHLETFQYTAPQDHEHDIGDVAKLSACIKMRNLRLDGVVINKMPASPALESLELRGCKSRSEVDLAPTFKSSKTLSIVEIHQMTVKDQGHLKKMVMPLTQVVISASYVNGTLVDDLKFNS